MNHPNARLDQINIVSGNLEASIAFYRRLGVDIPKERVWRTASGIHHASAGETENSATDALDVDNVIAGLLKTEHFSSIEELANTPAEELAAIEGFDEDVATELIRRAEAYLASRAKFELDSVAFARIWNKGWQDSQDLRGRVVVSFKLSSRDVVDAAYADLTGAGHRGLQAPYDAFWGSRYAVVEDPDGIAVGLVSPRSAELRSAPPEV